MKRRNPEHAFQGWCDRFLDRVVLPPMFTTGIDHASRDMANVARAAALKGRGVKFGVPDVYVVQAGKSVWLELKRGSTVSSNQIAVHEAMIAAGQAVHVCRTMLDVLTALRAAGFALHGNADALAAEYEMRAEAKEAAPRKASRSKPRAAKPPQSRLRQIAAVRGRVLF